MGNDENWAIAPCCSNALQEVLRTLCTWGIRFIHEDSSHLSTARIFLSEVASNWEWKVANGCKKPTTAPLTVSHNVDFSLSPGDPCPQDLHTVFAVPFAFFAVPGEDPFKRPNAMSLGFAVEDSPTLGCVDQNWQDHCTGKPHISGLTRNEKSPTEDAGHLCRDCSRKGIQGCAYSI